MKKIEDTKDSIKAVLGGLNVASFYFPGEVRDLHKGMANVQCLNAIVYRQWVGKTVEIFGKHVRFVPHPKSLQGAIPPTKEEQEKLGFCDISTVIADTLEATRNAPQREKHHDHTCRTRHISRDRHGQKEWTTYTRTQD